jgi:hypothetical protein
VFAIVLVVALVPGQDMRQLPSRLTSDVVIMPSETTAPSETTVPSETAGPSDTAEEEPAERTAPAEPQAEPNEEAAPADGDNGAEQAAPRARAERQPDQNCGRAYPDLCVPQPPPDLDCRDVTERDFRVLPPDPNDFDRDSDGIGCESSGEPFD